MTKFIPLLIITFFIMSCSNKNSDPESWSQKDLDQWFAEKEWVEGWKANPYSSINKLEMAKAVFRHPERWEKTFKFLASTNLNSIEDGRHEIDETNAFCIVSNYNTKTLEEAKFESHKNYIDIQYVIKGEELIGVAPVDDLKISEPYDEEKDLIFYETSNAAFPKATSKEFMVFFPSDGHCPGVMIDEPKPVKKLVVKIKVD